MMTFCSARGWPACWVGRGFDVVGQAGDATELLDAVRELRPSWPWSTSGCHRRTAPRVSTPRRRSGRSGPRSPSWCCRRTSTSITRWSLAGGRSIGYLLKSRVTDVADFVDAVGRIANGASVVDPLWWPNSSRRQARRSARRAQYARAGSVDVDGGGSVECRYRTAHLGHRGHRREARTEHPDETQPARDGR